MTQVRVLYDIFRQFSWGIVKRRTIRHPRRVVQLGHDQMVRVSGLSGHVSTQVNPSKDLSQGSLPIQRFFRHLFSFHLSAITIELSLVTRVAYSIVLRSTFMPLYDRN